MIDLDFRLRWFEDLREWRVIGSGGHYAGAKELVGIPDAVNMMMRSEADLILRRVEQK